MAGELARLGRHRHRQVAGRRHLVGEHPLKTIRQLLDEEFYANNENFIKSTSNSLPVPLTIVPALQRSCWLALC